MKICLDVSYREIFEECLQTRQYWKVIGYIVVASSDYVNNLRKAPRWGGGGEGKSLAI